MDCSHEDVLREHVENYWNFKQSLLCSELHFSLKDKKNPESWISERRRLSLQQNSDSVEQQRRNIHGKFLEFFETPA